MVKLALSTTQSTRINITATASPDDNVILLYGLVLYDLCNLLYRSSLISGLPMTNCVDQDWSG